MAQVVTASGPPASSGATQTPLRTLALRGSAWTVAGYGAAQLLRLGSNVALAWALAADGRQIFGLMAMVTIIMQGLEMFSDIGIAPGIIQSKRGGERAFLDTAWTIQVFRGIALWLVACAAAWPLGMFYYPQLTELLPVAGLSAVLAGLNSTSLVTANRNLAMGRLTVLVLVNQVVTVVAMVSLALVYRSVWALVIGGLIGAAVRMVLSHIAMPDAGNRFRWDSGAAREMLTFGRWIFLSTGVTFLALCADRLLLGKLVDQEVLGVYAIALALAMAPREICGVLARSVLFPALSMANRSDPQGLARRFYKARRLILLSGAVAVMGLVWLADPFFALLYSDLYADARWMAPLMAVGVWFAVLQVSADRLLLAIGDSRSLAAANVINFAVTCTAALIGYSRLGMTGFILGYGVGSAAGYLVIGLAMERRQISIVGRDALVTIGLAALIIAGLAVQRATGQWAAEAGRAWAAAAVATMMLVPAAVALAVTLKREVRHG